MLHDVFTFDFSSNVQEVIFPSNEKTATGSRRTRRESVRNLVHLGLVNEERETS